MNPFALSPGQMEEARQLYVLHDWPVSDIAEHFDVSNKAVMSALKHLGVDSSMREEPPPLRMKQCTRCLHFLPIGLFSGIDAKRTRIASWCNDCTNHPAPPKWTTDPAPLTNALTNWRTQ